MTILTLGQVRMLDMGNWKIPQVILTAPHSQCPLLTLIHILSFHSVLSSVARKLFKLFKATTSVKFAFNIS